MSEDPTRNLPNTFEERVLAELSTIRRVVTTLDGRMTSLEGRMTSLEEKVDARLRETRPIWEGVLARLDGVESELKNLNRQLRSLITDLFQVRVRVEKLEDEQQTA